MQVDKEINARGLNCPLPLMKTKLVISTMAPGQLLRVIATDAGSMPDILAFATQNGHEMVEQRNVGNEYIHILRRG